MAASSESPDYYFPSELSPRKYTYTVRMLPIDPNGYVALIEHRNGFGLFGGHVTQDEHRAHRPFDLLNLSHITPTGRRESIEEAHVDFGPFLQRAKHLGIAVVEMLRFSENKLLKTNILSPVIYIETPRIKYPKNILVTSIHDLPKNLYPDAAPALSRVKQLILKGPIKEIKPTYLNRNFYAVFFYDPPNNVTKYFPTP